MCQEILIVDDDRGVTGTLGDILTDLGYKVTTVNDGFEAVEAVRRCSFKAVLLDVMMPGMNGIETYKEIKKIRPGICVMFMTAYSVEDLIAEGLREGALGVLYKPLDVRKLIRFIERIRRESHREVNRNG